MLFDNASFSLSDEWFEQWNQQLKEECENQPPPKNGITFKEKEAS